MSGSKLDNIDLLDKQRTAKQAEAASEPLPVFKALQEVKSETGNVTEVPLTERNSYGADSRYQSTESLIKVAKERCEALQKFLDRSALGLIVETDSKTISELQTLINTYRKGSANLLLGKCYYPMIQDEYIEIYYYANELVDVAQKLPNSPFLQLAKSLMSKKFVKDNLADMQDRLLQGYLAVSQDNQNFINKMMRNELISHEFNLLRTWFGAHKAQCDFQFCLDLCNRLLEISCALRAREKIIDVLAEFGHLFTLLGKYLLSYNVLRETQTLKIEDTRTKCRVVCNLSVVELLLNEKEESLEHAKDSLRLAQKTKDREYIACTYGNIGLAYEYMGKYKEAIKPYEECLRLGKEATNYRVINNGLCNLGRAYQGIGDVEEAKKYFMQAIETLRPSKAFWCDTEDFRFSGDYLLAKLVLLNENNSDEAAKQFIEVIKRCETLRKRIQDSPIKITFNDTQRKPYQYLQHILLESGKEMEALVIAEKGRGRDYFDKFEDELFKQTDSEVALSDLVKSQGISVLFISTLKEVGKLCLWFISSEGKLLKQQSISYNKCKEVFDELCPALYETQGRNDIEFRGTTEDDYPLIERAFRLVNNDLSGNNDTTEAKTINEDVFFRNEPREPTVTYTREVMSTQEGRSLPKLIDKLSEMILSPFFEELESLAKKGTTGNKPRLLVIPQGTTFNIPFAALKLNGKPLCNYVTIIEAFSFNSFAHATSKSKNKTPTGNFKSALIVGNPTHDLPKAEEETKAIATKLAVTPLLKDEATKKAVVERLPNANLIHFGCHGEMGGRGLLLACDNANSYNDYHLNAEDVESMHLDADLVVLSACHTARGKINSEGVVGLARAFQVAGARSIVTSLWAIPDNAAKYFMENFYENLGDGLAVADAIRATQVTMQNNETYKDIINWGSFKVLGANAKIM